MDPPLCGPTAMSHNEFTIRKPIEPQEASPMKHEMNGLPCKFLARGSHLHVSGCPQGTWQLCRKVAFWRQNPKIGSRKINDLGAATFLFAVMCDRALGPRQHSDLGKLLGRFTNRPNLLQYACTGCEFPVTQELLPRLLHDPTRERARAGNVARRSPTVRGSSEAVRCYGCGATGVHGSVHTGTVG